MYAYQLLYGKNGHVYSRVNNIFMGTSCAAKKYYLFVCSVELFVDSQD